MKVYVCDACGATAEADATVHAHREQVQINPGSKTITVFITPEAIAGADDPHLCRLCARIAIRAAARRMVERILNEPSELDVPLTRRAPHAGMLSVVSPPTEQGTGSQATEGHQ